MQATLSGMQLVWLVLGMLGLVSLIFDWHWLLTQRAGLKDARLAAGASVGIVAGGTIICYLLGGFWTLMVVAACLFVFKALKFCFAPHKKDEAQSAVLTDLTHPGQPWGSLPPAARLNVRNGVLAFECGRWDVACGLFAAALEELEGMRIENLEAVLVRRWYARALAQRQENDKACRQLELAIARLEQLHASQELLPELCGELEKLKGDSPAP